MKKLKLDVENLEVNSFDVAPVEEPRGTVRGNEATDNCSQYCGWTSLDYYLGTSWMRAQ